jgi:hypothetical protein
MYGDIAEVWHAEDEYDAMKHGVHRGDSTAKIVRK